MQTFTEKFLTPQKEALTIDRVNNKRQEPEEFIQFHVHTSAINLNEYLFYDNTYESDHELSNAQRHMYRFPKSNLALSEGDVIRVYTQEPTPATRKGAHVHDKGLNVHYYNFYWGLKHDIWNNDGDKATLLHVRVADIKPVSAQS